MFSARLSLRTHSVLNSMAAVLVCVSSQVALGTAEAPSSEATGEWLRTRCSAELTVRSREESDAQNVCHGALAAIEFFTKHGVEVSEALEVKVVDELPPGLGATAVGCFDRKRRTPFVLSYRMFTRRGHWLGLEIDRRLYESVASHEVAHALAWCAAASPPLAIQATEYLAFVTMFGTMEPTRRNALLAAYPGITFENDLEINELSYALDALRFGVMSYRHYLRQPDRTGFIQRVLAGKALSAHYFYY